MSEIFQPNNQEKLIPLNDSNDNLEINSLIQKFQQHLLIFQWI